MDARSGPGVSYGNGFAHYPLMGKAEGMESKGVISGTNIATPRVREEGRVKRVSLKCHNPAVRSMGSKGFSLIEILVVVAILGMIAVIATVAVSKVIKRERVSSDARQLQGFINNAFVQAQVRSRGVFVTGVRNAADGSHTFQLVEDTNGNSSLDGPTTDLVIATQLVPSTTEVAGFPYSGAPSAYGTFGTNTWPFTGSGSTLKVILMCDSMGRAINPTVPGQIGQPVTLSLTHVEMLTGTLNPKIRFDLQVFPLWNCTVTQVRY